MSRLVVDPVYWDYIKAHPQDHVDDLVAAGVLEQGIDPWLRKPGPDWYCVVQPHEHDFYVFDIQSGPTNPTVTLQCTGCPAQRTVPNRLPIEVPKETP